MSRILRRESDHVEAERMDLRRDLRASDRDRQTTVDRLRVAMDEGRLTLHEFDERTARAYQAVTYGDLADLFVDLPDEPPRPEPSPAAPAVRQSPVQRQEPEAEPPVAEEPSRGFFLDLPTPIRVLWAVWLTVVSINLVVWLMVSIDGIVEGEGASGFWPIWVAGPWGAALLGLSAGATLVRRGRRQRRLAAKRRRQISS